MSQNVATAHGTASRPPVADPVPRWPRVALAVGTALSALTAVPAIDAASSPLLAPNELQELGYPLVGAPIGLAMVLVAVRLAIRTRTRWAALLAATGAGWVVNAFLVALRSWGVDGHLAHAPFVAATWIGQWSYVWPDVATFVLLPLALPTGRITGWWRAGGGLVLASAAVQVVCGALGGGRMDDAALLNPITGTALPGLLALRDDLYLPTMLAGVALVIARAVALRRELPGRLVVAVVGSVLGLVVAEVAEGILQGLDVPCYLPWAPAAAAVTAATLLWARIAARVAVPR